MIAFSKIAIVMMAILAAAVISYGLELEPLTGLILVAAMGKSALEVFQILYNHLTHADQDETRTNSVKILSYNVYFPSHVELNERMKAVGDLILLHFPDVICFQEITPEIYNIFEQSTWWNAYHCSVLHETVKTQRSFCMQLSRQPVNHFTFVPFENSKMGRGISLAEIEVCGHKPLVVATSHLKCPKPFLGNMFSKERVAEANKTMNHFKVSNYQNAILCGDMNWDEDLDGKFPLFGKWVDAWVKLRPKENGWTYDTESNPMLFGSEHCLQKRLDRFSCNLKDFKLKKIEMVGEKAVPGLFTGRRNGEGIGWFRN